MPLILSKSGYARHRGCAPSYVTKLIGQGKLSAPALRPDGTIDAEQADAMLGQPPAPNPGAAPAALPSLPLSDAPTYAAERARREAAEARLAEIKLATREAAILDTEAVSAAAEQVFSRAIQRLRAALPDISIAVAIMTDPAAITDRMEAELRRAMAGIHQEFLDDAARRSAA